MRVYGLCALVVVVGLFGFSKDWMTKTARQLGRKIVHSVGKADIFSSVNFWESELRGMIRNGRPPGWMKAQIEADFARISSAEISSGNNLLAMKENHSLDGSNLLLAHYRIKENRLSYSEYANKHHVRADLYAVIFQNLLKVASLPDMDFLVFLNDNTVEDPFPHPVFTWTKVDSMVGKVILIPDFELLSDYENVVRFVKKGIKKYPWKEKKGQAFWRGGGTGGYYTSDSFLTFPRSQLVTLSLSHPNLIDARLSSFPQGPNGTASLFPDYFGHSVSVPDHFQYKYQILADGNGCTCSRNFWQLASNCVMFKHDSPYILWYHHALLPYVHYIPCKRDFSDLPEQLEWARTHDRKVEAISQNARKFVNENLKKSDIYYYLYLVLTEYANRQNLKQ